MPLSVGDKLGPYEILGHIGSGGMGSVWKARDTRLGRDVAIKVSAREFNARFEREARAVAALNHPNICQLYDIGPDYLVMEFVEGTRLKGPLPVNQAIEYGCQILDALDAAHKKGITHRDLKPSNILVSKRGIKVLDFGLARMEMEDEDQTLTITGAVLGTPAYMSPEQREGKTADHRSDIYSFGCVLHEMLTGKRPGGDPTLSLAPLAGVIAGCLAQDPDERWQAARDVQRALKGAQPGVPRTKNGPAGLGLDHWTRLLSRNCIGILGAVASHCAGRLSSDPAERRSREQCHARGE